MALDHSPESFSPQMNLCSFGSNLWPPGAASFDPKGHHMNEIDKGLQGDATYQNLSSIPSSFREKEFRSWFSLFLCSNLWPPGRGQFWPYKHHMNKLGRCPQGDIKNQISKLYAFQFQRKRILKMGFFIPMFQIVTPGMGPILTPGASSKQTWSRSNRRCYIPNIKALALTVWDKKILKISFYICMWNPRNNNIGLISTPGP